MSENDGATVVTDSGTGPAEVVVVDVSEVADGAASDAALDAGSASDIEDVGGQDTPAPLDTAVPGVVSCATPSYLEQYPPPFPPFPYGAWPEAEGCMAAPHDAVIVLGCPSEEDGAAARCQEERAEMADLLYEAGWSEHFIVSGAAVHTPWVEAEALAALLVARGVPADAIVEEPRARHTDENIYYSTRIMEARGWRSAIVVSDDPGHLMFTGLCDASCCVALGRMTLVGFPVGGVTVVNAGHYALSPPGPGTTQAECAHLEALALCVNRDDRKACKDDFQLED